jgi:hypothetical protein
MGCYHPPPRLGIQILLLRYIYWKLDISEIDMFVDMRLYNPLSRPQFDILLLRYLHGNIELSLLDLSI